MYGAVCVRTALSPNAGLKRDEGSPQEAQDCIGQNSAKPERGIETAAGARHPGHADKSEQR